MAKKKTSEKVSRSSSKGAFRKYYNISEYRSRLWNLLKEAAELSAQHTEKIGHVAQDRRILNILSDLRKIECYWAFPGIRRLDKLEAMYNRGEHFAFANATEELVRLLVSRAYYNESPENTDLEEEHDKPRQYEKDTHYFEVLFVSDISDREEEELRAQLYAQRDPKDEFRYEIMVVRTFQDAIIALTFNHNIQSCIIRYAFPFKTSNDITAIKPLVAPWLNETNEARKSAEIGVHLGRVVKELRPELDLFFVTDMSVEKIREDALDHFRNIFYRQEDLTDLHLSILKGIDERYETPFYNALVSYSKRPTGVFHAMPISRGNSIFKSNWIREMGEFYGKNIFLAETSATTGGLDSLLQPTGPLKKSQEMAARAFGARNTYFVTNGTSTANKIVVQALIRPGDVVFIDRDCHKSHHYGLVLSGAMPVYLDSYHLEKYSMYGAIPLELIKAELLQFKKAGRLNEVKMLLLTNCTFDGIVYNVEQFMEEVLAIKPDMIFLWDEAWFGFARFSSLYKRRTAMYAAQRLLNKYRSAEYRSDYRNASAEAKKLLPDPDKVKIRVYATQSTHKTLTSLRQGSMIHVFDEQFAQKVEDSFTEAYMTHTSTSPSYQILASLDMGRRQAELEGNELVERSVERAMMIRVKIAHTPLLKKYFDVLTINDLIPPVHRKSGFERYYNPEKGWGNMTEEWKTDEFVLDPTKINLYIGRTGIDGDTFKKEYLMNQFGIQVNKTSRNTVLFMTNIGTTRSSVAKLISVLIRIAQQIEARAQSFSNQEIKLHNKKVVNLCEHQPALPNFSFFHKKFKQASTPEGNIREAFFMAYNEELCENLTIDECRVALAKGRQVVSASFVIPYPPGFPILVPGQVMTKDILEFMQALDVKEIHSYNAELGLRVFTEKSLR